jgi:triosephosphate isomerase
MRNKYIAGNWKMHKTIGEAMDLATELKKALAGSSYKLMVAPPFTALASVAKALEGSNILVGAQNMAAEEQGAHTGEVSVLMLKDAGASAVIIGHSERRLVYGETDELINRKVKLALQHGMEIVLCVGETLEQREASRAEQVVEEQLREDLNGVSADSLASVTIAYEPVWAIGTGKTATPEDAEAMHQHIRRVLEGAYSAAASSSMIIQYGGSVKPANAKGLLSMEDIDGALVGGASLKAETFVPIAEFDKQ